VLLVIVLVGAQLGVARAQGAQEPADASPVDASDAVAKGLFQAGAAAFDAGQFTEALEHFQAAYARSPRPKLLYNIGQAADRLRQDEVALDAFQRYLAEVPDADGREQIEARVRVLEQAVAEQRAAAADEEAREGTAHEPSPAPSVAPASPEPPPADTARPFPWIPVAVLGAGVVAMVAGAAFGMTAKSEEDDYSLLAVADAAGARDAKELLDDAKSHATVSNVLLGAGGALSVAAAVWLVIELSDGGDEQHEAAQRELPVVARLAPGELGLVVSGRFGGAP
jgi:tetratricopeptide (TPR) repeat protein